MKLGDLVQIKLGAGDRLAWGFGLIVEVFPSGYENHAPFVSVFWPKISKKTHTI